MDENSAPTPREEPSALAVGGFADWPPSKTYVGRATPRKGGGWEIRIVVPDPAAEGNNRLVGITECATLNQLEEKTWDFVHALTDAKDVHIASVPDVGEDLMTRVIGAWKAMKDAKEAEAKAAKSTREVVKELREKGLSVTDIAFLTHVSRGRVSQLLM
jgi:uncharacterized protein YciW